MNSVSGAKYLFEEFDEEMEPDQDGNAEEIDGCPSDEDTDEETSKFFPIHEPGNMLGQGAKRGRGGYKVILVAAEIDQRSTVKKVGFFEVCK